MIFAFQFSNILSLILFLVILCFVIGWHELGHLFVAKKCNVYCYEYSIGFGPQLYRNSKHETHFVIRAIPLGGFVKMAGEEGQGSEGDEEILKDNNGNVIPSNRVVGNLTHGRKIAVMAAGGIMNMILAVVCFYAYIVFNNGFALPRYNGRINVQAESLLAESGMESGDRITDMVTINETTGDVYTIHIKNIEGVTKALDQTKPTKVGEIQKIQITYIDATDSTIKNIEVSRKGEKLAEDSTLELTKIGLSQYVETYSYNAFTALYGTWHFMGENTALMFKALGNIFKGDLSQMSGLVGIYEVVDDVATTPVNFGAKLFYIIYLTGSISFSLGFFNLIPFPALDGGRIVFVLYSAITKKKVNPNVEATIHFVGLLLLFALMIFINVRDVFNLFS